VQKGKCQTRFPQISGAASAEVPMTSPAELRHAHFQKLYFSERSRREAIRSSISTPVAAISFAVFAFSTLATEFDAGRWQNFTSLAIVLAGGGSILALLGAAYHVVMVEWLFVSHEPPGLEDLVDAESRIRELRPDTVDHQVMELLTGSYAIAYQQYLCGNTMSARSRTWALRLVLTSLVLLAFAFLLLPLHLSR
jgi:hypothetical protein